MAMDVCKAFLDDAENSRFEVRWLASEIGRHFQMDFDTAPFFKSLGVPSQGALEAGFVQQGRVKKVGW